MDGALLIVAADAGLRERAFDGLAAAGCRVDGVADAASAARRLEKDRYDLVVVEEGLEVAASSAPVLDVEATVTTADLVDRVRQRLASDPETEPRA